MEAVELRAMEVMEGMERSPRGHGTMAVPSVVPVLAHEIAIAKIYHQSCGNYCCACLPYSMRSREEFHIRQEGQAR